jgi:hypothetical protein
VEPGGSAGAENGAVVDEAGWRNLPPWVRFAVLAVGALVVVALGMIAWRAGSGDDDEPDIEEVLDELAQDERTTATTEPIPIVTVGSTTTAPPTTTPETTPPTTTPPPTTPPEATTTTTTTTPPEATTTTTTSTTTTIATTVPSSTTSTTTTVPEPTTTPAPPETTPPDTTPPETTPPATPPPDTTSPPTTGRPVPPGAVAPSATAFAEDWNANAAGTDVPTLSRDDVTELETGTNARTFVARLSGKVGLVAVVRDDGSMAQILLAWIPGGDEATSTELYRGAFDVLVRTVNPALSDEERVALRDELGLDASRPPFPSAERATAEAFPQRYVRYVRDTAAADETAVISVIDARPR